MSAPRILAVRQVSGPERRPIATVSPMPRSGERLFARFRGRGSEGAAARRAPAALGIDETLPPAADGKTPLERRTDSYRRAGVLADDATIEARRERCSTCTRRRSSPDYPGLYGCGSCSTCTGGPERMLLTTSTCPKHVWRG